MKWTVKLVAEAEPGMLVEQEVITIERGELLSPATVGLTIAEGKAIMESLQREIVTKQVQHHGTSIRACSQCGKTFRTKGYYQSTLRSVYGKVPMRVRRLKGCSCMGSQRRSYSTLFTNKNPITPELKYLTAKMAALLPFGKVVEFLGELLPVSAQATVNTVRNRTLKVGKRLRTSAEALAGQSTRHSARDVVVGLDGGYVRARHRRPERNFEIVAGKVLDAGGTGTRFAFVRDGGPEAVAAAGLALRQHGVNESAALTVLSDGDAGLRAIHHELAPHAEHVLDWFHISMRFQNLKQVAKGIHGPADGAIRRHALDQLNRMKWRFWNGQVVRGLIGLVHLRQWAHARCFEHIPALRKLGNALLDTIRYLELNADSMPDYGRRFRNGSRISTGFAESAVNEIIAKRMNKKQQMRWSRYSVQLFLNVRIHVLNGTLEDAFRHWHRGFRPTASCFQHPIAA
jgi:hypothetical protein